MEERKRGGQRKGAGRKPTDNPKLTVTLYVEKKSMWPFGGKEKMIEAIYKFIQGKQSVESTIPTFHSNEPRTSWTAPVLTMQQKTELQFLKEISELEFPEEYQNKAAEIKAATYLGQKVIDRLILNLNAPKN